MARRSSDQAKFTAALVGIRFAVPLMMFAASMSVGVLNHASLTVIPVGAWVWGMDPAVHSPAQHDGDAGLPAGHGSSRL